MLTPRRFAPALAAVLLAGPVLVASGSAQAVEREHHIGVQGGLSLLKIDDKSTLDVGGGGGVHYAYGLSDQFNLMAEGTFNLVALNERAIDASTPGTRPSWVTNVAVGVGYVLDVLTRVPYAGIMVGGYYFGGGTIDGGKLRPGGQIALGLDYRLNRKLAVGVAFRQHYISSTYPSFSSFFARFEYTWGW
jgi:hypothetical protein